MTSDTPDPITAFLKQHAAPPTKEELKRLKSAERKRKARVQNYNTDWKDNAKTSDAGHRDLLR